MDNRLTESTVLFLSIVKWVFLATVAGTIVGGATAIFFVGTTAGLTFAMVFGLNAATFAAIGFVSVLAGAANTPIAASILAVEMFGPGVAPFATVACVISFLLTGHRSVYPSQVLSISKSPSLQVEIGRELEHIHAAYRPGRRGLVSGLLHLLKAIEELVERARNREL